MVNVALSAKLPRDSERQATFCPYHNDHRFRSRSDSAQAKPRAWQSFSGIPLCKRMAFRASRKARHEKTITLALCLILTTCQLPLRSASYI
jgi:hypothetical protein